MSEIKATIGWEWEGEGDWDDRTDDPPMQTTFDLEPESTFDIFIDSLSKYSRPHPKPVFHVLVHPEMLKTYKFVMDLAHGETDGTENLTDDV